jgi:hypothetical protein
MDPIIILFCSHDFSLPPFSNVQLHDIEVDRSLMEKLACASPLLLLLHSSDTGVSLGKSSHAESSFNAIYKLLELCTE